MDIPGARTVLGKTSSKLPGQPTLTKQAVEAWEPSNRPMLCLPGNKVCLTASTIIHTLYACVCVCV